jgi:hypothetical protein
MATGRHTYKEAARALGLSTEAVRRRVRRGTLPSERDPDGTVRVILDADQARPDETNLTDQLRSEVAYLREENQRKDHIIAALVQKVPALQAASNEPREDSISHDAPSRGYSEYRITTRGPAESILAWVVEPVIPIILPRADSIPCGGRAIRGGGRGLSASTRANNHADPQHLVMTTMPHDVVRGSRKPSRSVAYRIVDTSFREDILSEGG